MTTDAVKFTPAKRFFVDMLVRDIALQDAILDLLDNCVDGAARSAANVEEPYLQRWAKITLSEERFVIEDNCGGIPIAIAREHAFRLGRPDTRAADEVSTVGIYGIGMKRAVFKMGRNIVVESKTVAEDFCVHIDPKWLSDDNEWEIPLQSPTTEFSSPGTRVAVTQLRGEVSRLFGSSAGFVDDLCASIANYYAYILEKGFQVFVNGRRIVPNTIKLLISDSELNDEALAPYVYKSMHDEVEISVVIGLHRDLPGEDELQAGEERPLRETTGGITVMCNDRIVLHGDRTMLTGWGEVDVPRYHPQFAAISGLVSFRSKQPALLPMTTTKRGVEGNSLIWLATKERVREGIKTFTSFTNKWKSDTDGRKALKDNANAIEISRVVKRLEAKAERWQKVTKDIRGARFAPNLPKPKVDEPVRQIKFNRSASEIKRVSTYLFGEPDQPPTVVGTECFERILKKADPL